MLSLFSIGVYKLDLWELREATALFEEVKRLAQNAHSHRWAIKASSLLGFTKACLGATKEASDLAEEAYEGIIQDKSFEIEWFPYYLHIIGKTYKLLENCPKALDIYNQALVGTNDGNIQTRAKIIGSIAEIERAYRNYNVAVMHHLEAIELLTEIGAKCDLSENQFQLGLTYQEMGETEKSNLHFQLAIQLFNAMKAMKQVERVRQSMQKAK